LCCYFVSFTLFELLCVDNQPSASDSALEAFRRRLAATVSQSPSLTDQRRVDFSCDQVCSLQQFYTCFVWCLTSQLAMIVLYPATSLKHTLGNSCGIAGRYSSVIKEPSFNMVVLFINSH